MIIYACILRLSDGLPLSGTNDFSKISEVKVKEGKTLIKLILRMKHLSCQKLCLQEDNLTVHCFQNECASYMAVCDMDYAHILAYSFLNEMMKEFSMLYIPSVVASVKRPFAFIEFDGFVQKVQSKYNNVRSLTSHLGNLPEMTADLNLNPPKYIRLKDLQPSPPINNTVEKSKPSSPYSSISVPNGIHNGKGLKSEDAVKLQLKPIPWFGRIALILSFFCILLDVYRGYVTLTSVADPDEATVSIYHILAFIYEFILLFVQIYFLRNYSKYHKPRKERH